MKLMGKRKGSAKAYCGVKQFRYSKIFIPIQRRRNLGKSIQTRRAELLKVT